MTQDDGKKGQGWRWQLRTDPLPRLLRSRSEELRYFAQHDLLDQKVGPVEKLWELPEPQKILEQQASSGGWRYPAAKLQMRSQENYDQLETFRQLRVLVEEHGMNRRSRAISRAADFLFSFQTDEGDFRGICGNQYVPYYSAAFMELLTKAGYSADRRIDRGFRWLLSVRQDDGGWAFPLRTVGRNLGVDTFEAPTIEPDRSKPFSHMVTGIVLRAFAAHPTFSKSEEARRGGTLLKSRFFQPDRYPDRRSASFWTGFSYPFWFTDLLSAMDSLSRFAFDPDDPEIRKALEWFIHRQGAGGGWKLSLRIMARVEEPDSWIALAICRMLKRFAERDTLS